MCECVSDFTDLLTMPLSASYNLNSVVTERELLLDFRGGSFSIHHYHQVITFSRDHSDRVSREGVVFCFFLKLHFQTDF